MPTLEHFPVSKKEGGKAALDNAILAHRLCNRLDHSLRVGRSHRRDLERISKAREEGIRRSNVQIGNTEGGEIPTVETESATPKPKKVNAGKSHDDQPRNASDEAPAPTQEQAAPAGNAAPAANEAHGNETAPGQQDKPSKPDNGGGGNGN